MQTPPSHPEYPWQHLGGLVRAPWDAKKQHMRDPRVWPKGSPREPQGGGEAGVHVKPVTFKLGYIWGRTLAGCSRRVREVNFLVNTIIHVGSLFLARKTTCCVICP